MYVSCRDGKEMPDHVLSRVNDAFLSELVPACGFSVLAEMEKVSVKM